MNGKTAKRMTRMVVPLVTLLLGAAIGFAVRDATLRNKGDNCFVERREGAFKLINPLLECDAASGVLRTREIGPFQKKVEAVLNGRLAQHGAAVYFRELNDGLWFSLGDTEKFAPASLRKVPLMIALLKQAENGTGKGLLDREVKFDLSQDYNAGQNVKPSKMLEFGRRYTVRELIYRMIAYSDNNAFMFLTRIVDPVELDNVYVKLRMLNPQRGEDDQFLSVQTYASFFRVLYNATYLSKDASEWALEILSQSEFRNGLVSGVPPGVIVSHKFGEKSDAATGTVQLHDCGIVYYPQHPYLLCVMSKGPNFELLDDVIRDTSRVVYAEVDTQHRQH